jgi:P27 family predicted phage terminase small subunit
MSSGIPKGLGAEATRLWKGTVDTWQLDAPALTMLEDACKSLDRRRAAEKLVAKEGMTQTDRFGQIKSHPCMGIIRDEISSFVRLLKQLGLDVAGAAAMAKSPEDVWPTDREG